MTDKSHVGMGQQRCPVCLIVTDEVILLDTKLGDTLERENFIGFKLCELHDKQLNQEGYIALIETKNSINPRPGDGYQTGNYAMIQESLFKEITNIQVPKQRICFVEVGLLDKLAQVPVAPAEESLVEEQPLSKEGSSVEVEPVKEERWDKLE